MTGEKPIRESQQQDDHSQVERESDQAIPRAISDEKEAFTDPAVPDDRQRSKHEVRPNTSEPARSRSFIIPKEDTSTVEEKSDVAQPKVSRSNSMASVMQNSQPAHLSPDASPQPHEIMNHSDRLESQEDYHSAENPSSPQAFESEEDVDEHHDDITAGLPVRGETVKPCLWRRDIGKS